jgi:hypothetical protein
MPRGGYRPGAGRKPGGMSKRQAVLDHLLGVVLDEGREESERLTAAVAAAELLAKRRPISQPVPI